MDIFKRIKQIELHIYKYIYTHLFFPLFAWHGAGLTVAPCSCFPGYQAGQVTQVMSMCFNRMGRLFPAGTAASHLLTHLTSSTRLLPVCFAWGINIAFPRAAPPLPVCPIFKSTYDPTWLHDYPADSILFGF